MIKKVRDNARGSGKSYKTVYNMLTEIYNGKFNQKVLYVAKDKDLIEKVWEENFQEVGGLEKFLRCIHYSPIFKKEHACGWKSVFVDHYISEVKIERLKQKVLEMEFEIQQHQQSIGKGGMFL